MVETQVIGALVCCLPCHGPRASCEIPALVGLLLTAPRPDCPCPLQPEEVRQLVRVGQEAFLTQLLDIGFFHGWAGPGDWGCMGFAWTAAPLPCLEVITVQLRQPYSSPTSGFVTGSFSARCPALLLSRVLVQRPAPRKPAQGD